MSREKKTKRLKSELDQDQDQDSSQILHPIKYNKHGGYKYQTLYDDDEDYPFIKLLEAINMRAIDIPLQSQFPKMDLSALYCLGITLQEYARHLSTNILSQKRASENLPPFHTLFSQQELDASQLSSIIEKYKPSLKNIQPFPVVHARPNIEQEMSKQVRQKKSHTDYPLRINNEESYYEKMLRKPEWEGVLRRNRDPEAAALAAKIRREHNEKQIKKRKVEQAAVAAAEKIKQQQREMEMRQEQLLPPTPPADIFDMTSFSSSSQQKNRKKSSSSSSNKHNQKKRKARSDGF